MTHHRPKLWWFVYLPFAAHETVKKSDYFPNKCENNRFQQFSILFYHSTIYFAHQNVPHRLICSTGSYMRVQGPLPEKPEQQWL